MPKLLSALSVIAFLLSGAVSSAATTSINPFQKFVGRYEISRVEVLSNRRETGQTDFQFFERTDFAVRKIKNKFYLSYQDAFSPVRMVTMFDLNSGHTKEVSTGRFAEGRTSLSGDGRAAVAEFTYTSTWHDSQSGMSHEETSNRTAKFRDNQTEIVFNYTDEGQDVVCDPTTGRPICQTRVDDRRLVFHLRKM